MSLACPNCGSRFLRESRPRDFAEAVKRLWFVSPLRCTDCKTRFVARTVTPKEMHWARCPRCDRMDLNQWTGETWKPGLFMALKITLGAHRWRCEYCRLNFASFRKRKEIFSFGRWKRMNAGQARKEGRARADGRPAENTLRARTVVEYPRAEPDTLSAESNPPESL